MYKRQVYEKCANASLQLAPEKKRRFYRRRIVKSTKVAQGWKEMWKLNAELRMQNAELEDLECRIKGNGMFSRKGIIKGKTCPPEVDLPTA